MQKFFSRLFNDTFFPVKILALFKRIKIITRKTVGLLSLLVGAVGVAVVFLNPMPLLASLFPIHFENILWTGGLIHLEQSYVQSLLNIFWSELLISAGVSSTILVLGIGLLSKGFYHNLKAFWRGLKASPKATLHAPVRFYRNTVIWRNWLLEKIDYLQSESAKWKRTFQVLKSPYSLLRSMGFSPQMAIGLLFAGSAVGGGMVANETIFDGPSFSRGDSGVYNAPLDTPISMIEGTNTLRIDLGTTPVRNITIENVSVGTVFANSVIPSGQTTAVLIGGNPTSEGFAATRLEVGTFIFEKSRCKQLILSNINAHTLLITGNASDGQSIAPSPGTARMLAIGGGHHQADAMITSGGMYDRIWIQAPSSGVNGRVGTLKLSNLYTKGAPCELKNMDIGTMIIELNESGAGDGFATKDLIIGTDVTAANLTITDNVEVLISEPATISP